VGRGRSKCPSYHPPTPYTLSPLLKGGEGRGEGGSYTHVPCPFGALLQKPFEWREVLAAPPLRGGAAGGGGQPCGLAAASAWGRRPPKAGGGPTKYHQLAFRSSLHRISIITQPPLRKGFILPLLRLPVREKGLYTEQRRLFRGVS
jgi:hypothetical protein